MGTKLNDIQQAWVELYDDKGFKDRSLRVEYPREIPDLSKVKGFNDKTSSVKWQIPVGWQCVIFDDSNFKDSSFPLIGSGQVEANADLGSFSDKTSSLRWERK